MQSIVAHIWLKNNKGWYDQNTSDTCNIIEYTCDIEVTDCFVIVCVECKLRIRNYICAVHGSFPNQQQQQLQ